MFCICMRMKAACSAEIPWGTGTGVLGATVTCQPGKVRGQRTTGGATGTDKVTRSSGSTGRARGTGAAVLVLAALRSSTWSAVRQRGAEFTTGTCRGLR